MRRIACGSLQRGTLRLVQPVFAGGNDVDPVEVNELGAAVHHELLVALVTRLVALGVVSRTRSANSTREVVVKLTAKGKAQVARLVPIAHDYEAAAIAGVRPEELTILKNSLRRVYANMKNRELSLNAPRPAAKRERVRRAEAAE